MIGLSHLQWQHPDALTKSNLIFYFKVNKILFFSSHYVTLNSYTFILKQKKVLEYTTQ